MVNYKRVVCEVALVAVFSVITNGAPAGDCDEKYYDQSQNGTENYRLNIDGVVIAVAPAESLLAAASDIDFSEILALSEEFNEAQKPKPPASTMKPDWDKPWDSKPNPDKPQESGPMPLPKPGEPAAPVAPKSDVKDDKKDVNKRKHEKAQRLKQRLAHIIMPLLRRNLPHQHHEHH